MWDCITVPVNLGHNDQAVQLRGGKREKISSSRRPCILATPLKRHSFWEPQGVLLWPAPNYANTYFDLEQTRSVGAKPVTRRRPCHGSSAQDAQLIRSNQVPGFSKDQKNIWKGDWLQTFHTTNLPHLISVTHKSPTILIDALRRLRVFCTLGGRQSCSSH